jgi:AbrB family looped-hinge helix DNA binding protein
MNAQKPQDSAVDASPFICYTFYTGITYGRRVTFMNVPKGKYVWTVKVGEKGQFVIPKEARELFNIRPGDTLILFADEEKGIAILRDGQIEGIAEKIFGDSKKGEANE